MKTQFTKLIKNIANKIILSNNSNEYEKGLWHEADNLITIINN
jgi:hypothetical protein